MFNDTPARKTDWLLGVRNKEINKYIDKKINNKNNALTNLSACTVCLCGPVAQTPSWFTTDLRSLTINVGFSNKNIPDGNLTVNKNVLNGSLNKYLIF